MPVQRWTLFDPLGNGGAGETFTFPINPNEGGTPAKQRNYSEEFVLDPSGPVVLFEGARSSMTIDFSGVIRDEATYTALYDTWFEKNHQVLLTDDLDRQFWIVFEKVDPKRKRAAWTPWKHDYSMTARVIQAL